MNIFHGSNGVVLRLDADRFTPKQLAELVSEAPATVRFRFDCNRLSTRETLDTLPQRNFQILDEPEAGRLTYVDLSRAQRAHLSDILASLKSDQILRLFMDRKNSDSQWKSHLNERFAGVHHFERACLALGAHEYLRQIENPVTVSIRPSTPHGIKTYIECFVLERIGIPVYILGRSAIPGFSKLYRGIGGLRSEVRLNLLPEQRIPEYEKRSCEYVELNRNKYDQAIPDYERDRFVANAGKYYNWQRDIRKNIKRPYEWLNTFRCWQTLIRLSTPFSDLVNEKKVIFFLHYQPERTSLPEADGFATQLSAIMQLRLAMPDDFRLVVKEHPSTFTNRCDAKWRTPDFYEQLVAQPGIDLLDIKTDSFRAIDTAAAVATLTGTVGLQGLIRGTPAIFFGSAMISGVYGQHIFKNFCSLQAFLENVSKRYFKPHNITHSAQQKILTDSSNVFELGEPNRFSNNCAELYDFLLASFRAIPT